MSFRENGERLDTPDRQLFPGWWDIAGRRAMFGDLVAARREKRPPEFTLERARRDVGLIEGAYRSAGLRLPVPAEEVS